MSPEAAACDNALLDTLAAMPGVSQRIEHRVRQDFGGASADAVLNRLAAIDLPLQESEDGRERVQAAIVLPARGRYSVLERQIELAEVDWRDVLVAARLGDDDWREQLQTRL
jgi:hypothetical protein